MFRTIAVVVFSLMPFVAWGQADADYRNWTVEQLCDSRADRAAWAELKRRDVFDRHELRAINKAEVQEDIGLAALKCILGEPLSIVRLAMSVDGQLDAYTFSAEENEALVVHVYSDGETATVRRSMAMSDAAYDLSQWTGEGQVDPGSCPEDHTMDPICAQVQRDRACDQFRNGRTCATGAYGSPDIRGVERVIGVMGW
jgi:hypothetical protein